MTFWGPGFKKTGLVAIVPKLEAAQWIDYLVLKIKTFVFFFTVKLEERLTLAVHILILIPL